MRNFKHPLRIGLGCLLLALVILPLVSNPGAARNGSTVSALYCRIDGSINPAQKDLLENALAECEQKEHDLLLLGLDTPGGLGQSMREMIKLILNAPVPVVIWVGPQGAHAASAGVFLVAASDVAAMSPQTSIGAASPVAMGGKEIPETMAKKIQNDFMSLIRSMAEAKGRNVQWYERSVEEAVSITASEAVQKKVVDLMAVSPEDLMTQIGAQGLFKAQAIGPFSEKEFEIVTYEPGFRFALLSWLLHPQIAYFLLLGGMAGLFFELTNPGAIFPGAFGAICLLLGLYAMAVLPTTAAGLLLIVLSLILFILEIAITSFGLLSIGGVICLFIGSMILYKFEYGLVMLPLKVILPTVLAVSGFMILGVYLITKAYRRPKQTGYQSMQGLPATVLEWSDGQGRIRVRGEIWKARSADGTSLNPNDRVRISGADGLTLIVRPDEPNNQPQGELQ
ncbi:MAG: nodulation protein NfeD [Desulfohalobiaceae bacterium]|nr:nodulation protein NfeD [Desulfohalobiaceae bacterium]